MHITTSGSPLITKINLKLMKFGPIQVWFARVCFSQTAWAKKRNYLAQSESPYQAYQSYHRSLGLTYELIGL